MADGIALAAVLTAYRPDDALAIRFEPLLKLCRWIVVVDNTPGGHPFGILPAGFVTLQDGVNKGLGPALNRGVEEAARLGAQSVILFDQDSTPTVEMVTALLGARGNVMGADDAQICVGPRFVDDSLMEHPTAISGVHATEVTPMTCLPTSGMLIPVQPFRNSGGFANDFFLDFVDFEWCWRMRSRGWRFFRVEQAPMYHRLGLAQRRLLGLSFHVPAPYRHYFQFRDTLRLSIRSYVPLYARVRFLTLLPMKLLIYPWLLDRGQERLNWMFRGISDAIRGRSGAGAAAAKLGA